LSRADCMTPKLSGYGRDRGFLPEPGACDGTKTSRVFVRWHETLPVVHPGDTHTHTLSPEPGENVPPPRHPLSAKILFFLRPLKGRRNPALGNNKNLPVLVRRPTRFPAFPPRDTCRHDAELPPLHNPRRACLGGGRAARACADSLPARLTSRLVHPRRATRWHARLVPSARWLEPLRVREGRCAGARGETHRLASGHGRIRGHSIPPSLRSAAAGHVLAARRPDARVCLLQSRNGRYGLDAAPTFCLAALSSLESPPAAHRAPLRRHALMAETGRLDGSFSLSLSLSLSAQGPKATGSPSWSQSRSAPFRRTRNANYRSLAGVGKIPTFCVSPRESSDVSCLPAHACFRAAQSAYRGTSLISNRPPMGPYIRLMPRALWWS